MGGSGRLYEIALALDSIKTKYTTNKTAGVFKSYRISKYMT